MSIEAFFDPLLSIHLWRALKLFRGEGCFTYISKLGLYIFIISYVYPEGFSHLSEEFDALASGFSIELNHMNIENKFNQLVEMAP